MTLADLLNIVVALAVTGLVGVCALLRWGEYVAGRRGR